MSKYPDNVVFDYEEKKFDANIKEYPTSSSSPNFSVEVQTNHYLMNVKIILKLNSKNYRTNIKRSKENMNGPN